jgi:hypothetical protein
VVRRLPGLAVGEARDARAGTRLGEIQRLRVRQQHHGARVLGADRLLGVRQHRRRHRHHPRRAPRHRHLGRGIGPERHPELLRGRRLRQRGIRVRDVQGELGALDESTDPHQASETHRAADQRTATSEAEAFLVALLGAAGTGQAVTACRVGAVLTHAIAVWRLAPVTLEQSNTFR